MERDVQRRRQLVWDIDRRLQEDIARPILFLYAKGHVLVASDEGLKITSEQHL
jgi:peptide/nickel transport system substrate-binding protein